MTLYEMTAAARALYELFAAEEIDEQTVEDTLESLGVEGKLEDCCKVIRQFEAEAQMFKDEAAKLTTKKDRAEMSIARLKAAIKQFLIISGKDKEKCGLFEVGLRKSQAVNITDEKLIPAEYKIAQPDKVDKAGIRAVLLEGGRLPGAELQTNQSVQIK